eukprot:2627753-Karenia_brevis.AAC.1
MKNLWAHRKSPAQAKKKTLLGRQPEPCTSKNLWERNQIPTEANERTFGRAGTALHKQIREPFGKAARALHKLRTFGNATRAQHMREPLGAQKELCTSRQDNLWEGNQSPAQ